jgi:hypothetical protein
MGIPALGREAFYTGWNERVGAPPESVTVRGGAELANTADHMAALQLEPWVAPEDWFNADGVQVDTNPVHDVWINRHNAFPANDMFVDPGAGAPPPGTYRFTGEIYHSSNPVTAALVRYERIQE